MKTAIVALASLTWIAAGLALGQEPSIKAPPSVKSMPPSVVKTVPMSGDEAVDAAATTQIKATFSKVMQDGNWAWVQTSNDTFPKIVGKPRYLEDKKTCVVGR